MEVESVKPDVDGAVGAAVTVSLPEATLRLRQKAREFALREVRPGAAERDRVSDPLEAFSWEVWRKASRAGWRTLAMPPEHGGIGMDVLTHCVLLEEFCASGDPGFGAAIHQVWKLEKLLLENEYLKQEVLPRFLADDDFMFTLGMTEPDSGTDNVLPYDGLDGGSRTLAVQQPDGDWVIDGTKHFLFAGGISKGTFLLCRTDPAQGMSSGATLFYVDHSLPGFKVGHVHSKLGWRTGPNGRLTFDHVRVPDAARMSPVGAGVGYVGAFGRPHAPTTSSFAIGTARAIYEHTLQWCREFRQRGRPLIEHQSVALLLADMYTNIELARTITWKAAWSGENNPEHDVKWGIVSQLFSAEMVNQVAFSAMRIWGARGYERSWPIEKLVRDGLANYHLDGLNDINRLRITRSLMGMTGGYIG